MMKPVIRLHGDWMNVWADITVELSYKRSMIKVQSPLLIIIPASSLIQMNVREQMNKEK